MKPLLEIDNLKLTIDDQEILRGASLKINNGQTVAIMGPNGSGKSSLALLIAGHPKYQNHQGRLKFQGQKLDQLSPEERAQAGIFLSFQHPKAIPGVTVSNILRASLNSLKKAKGETTLDIAGFLKLVKPFLAELKLPIAILNQNLNENFSGGEKKKLEMLQLMVIKPKLAILDEIDSGLDIDSLTNIAKKINALKSPTRSFLIITHYNRLLKQIQPDKVCVLKQGQIVREGDYQLAIKIEERGYDSF